ncbi:MAG: alkaline phosphatase family protein, partial [Candidatus Sericytochromatia bacterium]
NWLQASGIPGVVLLSGDRHHSEFLRRERQGAYPLYEWTVSPLTSKPYPPYEQEREVPERVPGSLLVERNFGLIDVSGQTGSRRLHLQLVDAQGHTRWQQELTQQELK